MDFRTSIPLAPGIISQTPPAVIELLMQLWEENRALREENRALREENHMLRQQLATLLARVEELEVKLNQNSSNSNRPPSSDSPFIAKPDSPQKKPKKKRKRTGSRQQCMRPTEVREIHPESCSCGCNTCTQLEDYYVHQVIEVPETKLQVTHIILQRGKCSHCGKIVKAHIPQDLRTGFGPRACATILELYGVQGVSRRGVQDFADSVLGFHISQGAIQKVVDLGSNALKSPCEVIHTTVDAAPVNYIDETPWKQKKKIETLWVRATPNAAYFKIQDSRSQKACDTILGSYNGYLVSDDYATYIRWPERQSCLAHFIRRAQSLSERANSFIAHAGKLIQAELKRLCAMGRCPPSINEWVAHCMRIGKLIKRYRDQDGDLGRFVRRIEARLENLHFFLSHPGVDPTNNLAERSLRYAVQWRKRSFGTRVDKGDRFVERFLSVRQTCRLRKKRTFPILVEAITAYFNQELPDTSWI